jgi:hypothetical protein
VAASSGSSAAASSGDLSPRKVIGPKSAAVAGVNVSSSVDDIPLAAREEGAAPGISPDFAGSALHPPQAGRELRYPLPSAALIAVIRNAITDAQLADQCRNLLVRINFLHIGNELTVQTFEGVVQSHASEFNMSSLNE